MSESLLQTDQSQVVDKSQFPDAVDIQILKTDKRYVNIRNSRASSFLATAEQTSVNYEICISLFSQALEQSCLGLIVTFLGYYPNLHRLSHLMDLLPIVRSIINTNFSKRNRSRSVDAFTRAHNLLSDLFLLAGL
ncbi:hypothetical protein [Albibacterium indicum]|uniref:hypothetical protein n=1 Tax=Albibacterium indicum TaxID=2292082 RepID=UPI001300B259|nr:hypothetical protein [Pedobacter indicus]